MPDALVYPTGITATPSTTPTLRSKLGITTPNSSTTTPAHCHVQPISLPRRESHPFGQGWEGEGGGHASIHHTVPRQRSNYDSGPIRINGSSNGYCASWGLAVVNCICGTSALAFFLKLPSFCRIPQTYGDHSQGLLPEGGLPHPSGHCPRKGFFVFIFRFEILEVMVNFLSGDTRRPSASPPPWFRGSSKSLLASSSITAGSFL